MIESKPKPCDVRHMTLSELDYGESLSRRSSRWAKKCDSE